MKLLKRFIALAAVVLMAGTAHAQVAIDSTTLSAAITSPTATAISLGSVTCTGCTFGVDTLIYVDLESMRVTRAYTTGTSNIPVLRGQDGTRSAMHKNGATVYLGPGLRFHGAASTGLVAGDPPVGGCNRTAQPFLPWINVFTGWVWICDSQTDAAANWRVTVPYSLTSNSR